MVLFWLFIRHQKQLSTVVKSAPQISKLFGGGFIVLPELFNNKTMATTSASMPNLASSPEITPTPKQFHTLQPRSTAPPSVETHKSSNPELTEAPFISTGSSRAKSQKDNSPGDMLQGLSGKM